MQRVGSIACLLAMFPASGDATPDLPVPNILAILRCRSLPRRMIDQPHREMRSRATCDPPPRYHRNLRTFVRAVAANAAATTVMGVHTDRKSTRLNSSH